jgi:hypothetical protein
MEEHDDALVAAATAASEAATIKEHIETNKGEIETLRSHMASLAVAKVETTPPNLEATAEAVYKDLLGDFDNPLLAEDSTVAAEKAKLEPLYLVLSNAFAEFGKYKAMLTAAAETAAAKAAEKAAASKPPELDSPTDGGAATGLLAVTAGPLRPEGTLGRETPYTARTVVARPNRQPQPAGTDMGNAAGTTPTAAAATAPKKPPRERTEDELLASVPKVSKTVDGAAMAD